MPLSELTCHLREALRSQDLHSSNDLCLSILPNIEVSIDKFLRTKDTNYTDALGIASEISINDTNPCSSYDSTRKTLSQGSVKGTYGQCERKANSSKSDQNNQVP